MKFKVPDPEIILQLAAQTGPKRIRFVAGCEGCGVVCTLNREEIPDMSCRCCRLNGRRTAGGQKNRRQSGKYHVPIPIDAIASTFRSYKSDRLVQEALAECASP